MPKSIKTRIQNKHDVAENWQSAVNFVPLAGEIIVYDADDTHDVPRVKIGDGVTPVNQLEFIDAKLAAAEHGTHVSFDTANPAMDGTASAGTANTVARSDHKHPTDTTRASKEELTAHIATHAPANAEKNQNAFSNIKVGSTTIAADNTTDTLELVAGTNISITPDANNDKITIAATDTVYTHPTTSGNKHIPSGGASGQILRWSADGTAVWGADNNTTYSAGTGISISNNTINNAGVRSVTPGTTNGTIKVNTNGTEAEVAVKGLGSAAYTKSTDYDVAGAASTAVSTHNTKTDTHNDIRLLISELTERLNALADSDDTTLDQMSEIVAYIKSNKDLIDGITTGKVSVSDIVNNLTTNVTNKPLSAAQGVVLKSAIDTLKYAGSSTTGGAANSANKLNTDAGSTTQPVYFSNGIPVKTTYTLAKSVPADAKFTDTVYTHPSYTAKSAGLYKVTVDSTGHVSNATAVTKADITALGIPAQDTTYSNGTATTPGLTKLYTGTGNNADGTMTQSAITNALAGKETSGAAAAALTNANNYTDAKVDSLISCGTADPSSSITSQFYFKYSTD